jgi:hypothetical protein
MHSGQLVFAQVMAYLPLKAFSRMVAARRAQHKVQDFAHPAELYSTEVSVSKVIFRYLTHPTHPAHLNHLLQHF